jgi:hypothetical protein
VTPEHRIEVSSRTRDEFHNGKDYYALHGKQMSMPEHADREPAVDCLEVAQRKCVPELSAEAPRLAGGDEVKSESRIALVYLRAR